MAARYFLNIGVNWSSTANWSDSDGGTGGFSVPTNADDVFFTALSGNCTVNSVLREFKTINFTGYTNTITVEQSLVAYGSVTLSATMTIAGSNLLYVVASGTLTSNGKTWPNNFGLFSGATITLADDWTIGGLVTLNTVTVNQTTTQKIIATNGLFLQGGDASGTAKIELTGGTWSSSGVQLNNNFDINGNITISGAVFYGTGTITKVSGTINYGTSTVNFSNNCTITGFGSELFYNLSIYTNMTLTSNLSCSNTFAGGNNAVYTLNGYTIYCGGIYVGSTVGGIQGTTEFVVNSTGSWTSIGGSLKNNLTINTAGTFTLSGNIYFSGATMTYIAGTVVTTGSTLTVTNSNTFDVDGIIFNTLLFTLPVGTQTLLSDLHVNLFFATGATGTILNGFNLYCSSLTIGAATGSWTTNVIMNGTGTLDLTAGLNANLEINTAGTVTCTASHILGGTNRTLKWTQGNVITNGSSFTFSPNTTITIIWPKESVKFWNVLFNSGSVITFTYDVIVENMFMSTTSATGTFNGSTVYVGGSFIHRIGATIGTTNFVMNGNGSLSCQLSGSFQNNLTIDTNGAITFDGPIAYNTGTFAITKGKIYHIGNSQLTIGGNNTRLIGFDQTAFFTVSVNSGSNLVMDRFFGGNVVNPTIVSSSGTTQFNLEITDSVSVSHGALVSGCNVLTTSGGLRLTHLSANRGRNTNILFGYADSDTGLPRNVRTQFLRSAYTTETINFMTAAAITENSSVYFSGTTQAVRGYKLWEYMDEHIRNLKGQGPLNQTYNLWSKMIAVYPFIGGTSTSHKFNLINPLDTDAAFRLTYTNSLIHSGLGVLGQPNAYAVTNLIPSSHLSLDDVHISNYLNVYTSEYYEMGIFQFGSGLYKRTRTASNYPPGIDTAVNSTYTNAQTTGKHVILSRLSSSTFYAYNNGISSSVANSSGSLDSGNFPLFCILNVGTYNNFTGNTHVYDTIGYGLTDAEAAMLYTIIQKLQSQLKRDLIDSYV